MPKRKREESHQTAVHDFTLSSKHCGDPEELRTALSGWAKHYVYQLECGDSGYIHFQGRISLIKKRRHNELVSVLKEEPILSKCHWSTTSTEAVKGDNFYCLKKDTFMEGPWKDTDIVIPLTSQLENFMKLPRYPYQEKLEEIVKEYDERTIHWINDQDGNHGKSVFCEYLEYHKLAIELPPIRTMEDLMQVAHGAWEAQPENRAFVVDLPRGMKGNKLADFLAAIETIKNGKVYDKRYKYKAQRYNRPQIILFTNQEPDLKLLTRSRWKIWKISLSHDLEPVEPMT